MASRKTRTPCISTACVPTAVGAANIAPACKGKARDQVQEGRWALEGDILILRIEKVNGVHAPRTDTYKMLAHTRERAEISQPGLEFSLYAAAGGGRFPDAGLRAGQLS